MTLTTDNSKNTTNALLREARAVKKTAKAYTTLNRGSSAAERRSQSVSRDIVLSYIGGGRV